MHSYRFVTRRLAGGFLTAGLTFLFSFLVLPSTASAVDCPIQGDAWQFVADVTIPDGTSIPAGSSFTKIWRLRNCGTTDWVGFEGRKVSATNADYGPSSFPLPFARPDDFVDVVVPMTAPTTPGAHRVNYKVWTPNTGFLVEEFWVDIVVPGSSNFTLNVGVSGSGNVQSSPGGISCPGACAASFASGSMVTLVPSAGPGWIFSSWGGDSDCADGVVTMNSDRSCQATFVPDTGVSYTLNVLKLGSGSGSVTGPGINCGTDCSGAFPDGASVTLAATPAPSSTFGGWGGDCSSSGQVVMSGDKTCTATFNGVVTTPTLDLVVSPTVLGTTSDGWPANNPVEVNVTASCPGSCSGDLVLNVGLLGGAGRFYLYETTSTSGCLLSDDDPGDRFSATALLLQCPLNFPSGGTASYGLKLWMQPSGGGTMPVEASFKGLVENESVSVPKANVHPLVFVHGILGSMPPKNRLIDNRGAARQYFDPFLGHYRPILDTLLKMGYEWNKTLFGITYDWRAPNEVSAAFLDGALSGTVIPRSRGVSYVSDETKADLLVHSMGGLVARSYIQGGSWDGNIRKAIFVATPHRGFPFDYRTWEGMTWADYVYNAPPWLIGGPLFTVVTNKLLWPTLVAKRYQPSLLELAFCDSLDTDILESPVLPDLDGVFVFVNDPFPNLYLCDSDRVAGWQHSAQPRGVGSLSQMLPTDDMGPYLFNPIFGNPNPFGHETNTWLQTLNAGIGLLGTRLGTGNIYVLAGEGAPVTDDHYNVLAPPPFTQMWNHGQVLPFAPFVQETSAGDDLIPIESSTFNRSGLLAIPSGNEKILDAAPNPGGARHSPIMHHDQTQKKWVPTFLAGQELPFKTDYVAPGLFTEDLKEIVTVTIACPVDVELIDPTGRRLSFDSTTGTSVNDFPNALYVGQGEEPQFLGVQNPGPGTYQLKLTGRPDVGADPRFLVRVDRVGGSVGEILVAGGTTAPSQEDIYAFELVPNEPPIADAGADQNLDANASCLAEVTLDGSGSSDPDGDELTYEWQSLFGTFHGVQPVATLPAGTHTLVLTVDDGKGQIATDTVVIEIVDRTPPVIFAPALVSAEQTSLDGTPLTLEEPEVVENCSLASFTNDAPAVFPLGSTVVTYTAEDEAGNVSTASTTVTIVDTTPPVLANVPAPVTVEQATLAGTRVTLTPPTASDICDADVMIESDAPEIFPLGVTTVTFTATDDSGNAALAETTVTVVDTTPPEIANVPAPVTAEQTNHDGTPVALPLPTATDICDADVTITSDAPSTFPLGETLVTFTARDDSGNVSRATTTVTIVDTTPPEIRKLKASPSSLWPPNHKMVDVRIVPTVYDICDVAPSCRIVDVKSSDPVTGKGDKTSPDWRVVAALAVELRAERAGGNKSGRTYTVTVKCTDDSGNSSTKKVTIQVPHDQGGGSGSGSGSGNGKGKGKGKKR